MRRLSAILLLLAANQLFAQGGRYAEISSVSVDTTSQRRVTINWNVVEVVNGQAFAIYHWENDKWVLIVDSLPADMRSYQDVKAHPFEHAERYSISTSIPGNPNAPLSDWHQTVFLSSGDYDKCQQSLTLNWSAYVGTSVANYAVYGRKIGQPYREFGSTADTTFATDKLEEGTDYNFIIVANLQNGQKSLSNIISYTTFKYIWPDESLVSIDTLFNHQGKVELRGQVDPATNIKNYSIFGVADNNVLINEEIAYTSNRFVLEADYPDANYNLVGMNYCGVGWGTYSHAQPLVIEADADAETVNLKWNISLSNNETYRVFCSVDGATENNVANDIAETEIELNFNDLADERAQNFCIRVEARDGERFSASNTVCVERKADLWLPTAFTPNGDGLNDTFGPVVKSAQITDFEFIVYDRYGGRVFVSTSPDNRWDGTHGGKHVAEGGYPYYMKAKLQNGQTIERKGSVNVVYP